MRIVLCFLVAASASTTLAPSSVELRSRYGVPDSEHRNVDGGLDSEDFTMRPGISLTAHYGMDRRACRITVVSALDMGSSIQRQYLTVETVPNLLQELAPLALRGKEFGEDVQRYSVRVTEAVLFPEYAEYENVVVTQTSNVWGVSDITLSFKRAGCPKGNIPFTFYPPPDANTILALTPTGRELRKRYGAADSEADIYDIFFIPPDIKLGVKYGSDHHACRLEIEPADLLNPYIASEKVTELFDQIAPAPMRGKRMGGGVFRSTCNGVWSYAYENVLIEGSPNLCGPHPGTEKRATIKFKRGDVCVNPYASAKGTSSTPD